MSHVSIVMAKQLTSEVSLKLLSETLRKTGVPINSPTPLDTKVAVKNAI